MATIDINNNLMLQSPYLYCQAAGCDYDSTEPGIHLRWDLLHDLGNVHIPKGDLFFQRTGQEIGFSKNEDYVSIYRAAVIPYGSSVEVQGLGDYTVLPGYAGLSFDIGPTLIVRFLDRAQFKTLLENGSFQTLFDFQQAYEGIIELEIQDQLLYRYELNFDSEDPSAAINIETVTIGNIFDASTEKVIKREYADVSQEQNIDTTADNIKYIRFHNRTDVQFLVITYHTYAEAFEYYQSNDLWEKIGDFALTLEDDEAYSRFQGTPYSGGELTLNWPKFNEGLMVYPPNYQDRWTNDEDGLKKIIDEFIDLSINDPRANVNLPSETGDDNAITVSMLDMLKLVALDYHAARMMGLGLLDKDVSWETKFVYAAVYTTHPGLPYVNTDVDHVFLTLPTDRSDYRLPVAPFLKPVSYGLYVDTNGSGNPELLSDPNGYSFYDNVRFVNLSKINQNRPQDILSFIPPDDAFDASNITQPSVFGIEYKGTSESQWRSPEILHDEEYSDPDGIPETSFIPENEENTLYVHKETETGSHEYALYSINWFNRVSDISNGETTDATVFPKRNTLLPPFNFSVQYIQEEDPLIFTTQSEQNELDAANAANPNGDNYKTRVTFDWNNLHNNAYQSANKIEFFFRDTPIKKIEGKIVSVNSISTTECIVSTGPFTVASVNPPLVVSPMITQPEAPLYIGSLLNTPEGQFQIVSVQASSPGPVFTVKKLVATETAQATPDDPVITIPVYTEPNANEIFFVFENVSEANHWVKLNRTVDIYNFSNATEPVYEDDGSVHTEVVGGINGNATIQAIQDPVNPGAMTGGYTVEFNAGVNLPVVAGVTWTKGSARFTINSFPNKKKPLPVVSIQQTSPVKIVVFDPDYFAEPTQRISTGNNIPVNFHPGYKIYLSPQPSVFDKTKTMPAGTANNKKTYLAARSADTTIPLYSSLTQPAILVARNIQKPLAPESILGPLFATRPDFYGKSTYTVDVRLTINNRSPFGVVVYRANDMSILQTLYKPETLQQVIADLAAIEDDDPYKFNRWRSLVEVELDPNDNNKFKLFGSYRFPNPDNPSTEIFPSSASASIRPFPLQQGETLLTKKAIIKKTIEDIFSPLTETPVIFEYLKTGYQTSADIPKTRSIIGRLLSPSDPDFNPFPMAVKFPAGTPNTVRFTDYSLSGNSRNIYFYFAREIAVDAKLSERTVIFGPIILVDAAPAEKPTIRRIVTQEEDPILNKPAAVFFDLADYISSERIKQFQVFRTTNFSNAATVRTMQLASTIDSSDEVKDSFTDLSFPPFGQPLFYRLVALREIINEKGESEMIPSQPSEMMLANIIDVMNPAAPEITPSIGSTQTNGSGQVTALLNVTLQWPQTVYNGTYYLYKMNSQGNWEKLWSKKTNAVQVVFPENGDFVTWPQTANLPKLDDDGNVIYHRFKVSVENASGLFNLEDKELVI